MTVDGSNVRTRGLSTILAVALSLCASPAAADALTDMNCIADRAADLVSEIIPRVEAGESFKWVVMEATLPAVKCGNRHSLDRRLIEGVPGRKARLSHILAPWLAKLMEARDIHSRSHSEFGLVMGLAKSGLETAEADCVAWARTEPLILLRPYRQLNADEVEVLCEIVETRGLLVAHSFLVGSQDRLLDASPTFRAAMGIAASQREPAHDG